MAMNFIISRAISSLRRGPNNPESGSIIPPRVHGIQIL
jgi:hypothetical protein